jgi:heme o synthase
MLSRRFANFAWFVLFYNVLVILWGAFVRASFSGDGCGSHWPLCNGSVIPSFADSKTIIEYTHRLMSGLDGFLVLGLVIWAFRLRTSFQAAPDEGTQRALRHVRASSLVVLFFIIVESLIGMGLVKFGWVAHDASAARAVVLAVHLVNTFFLLGALTYCAMWASGTPPTRFKGQGAMPLVLGLGLVGLLLLGISGAVTALGDTLFPVSSSSQAVMDSLDPTKHFLVRLRVLHPLLAVSIGLYLVLISGLVSHLRPSPRVKEASNWVIGLFATQIVVGLLNVFLKAPIAMQLIHLLLADATWIALVAMTAAALAEGVEKVEMAPRAPEFEGMRAGWREYLALTKPRVISLLLFTTLTALFAAAGGWPGWGLLLGVALGGYMAAGAANTINMVIDRDIDGTMKRTAKRPTVTQMISSTNALLFGFGLAAGSFALLWWVANLLTAMLSLAGLAFYVVIYTLMLKRRTWHNIVIGGAAGAFPPLVGWTAYTNELNPLAWYLFAIIFVWTPVHFWALALLIKDDYANAGVPMLPVVRGERATVIQIVFYAILTAIVSVLPILEPSVGWPYFIVAVVLNLVLLIRCIQLYTTTDRPRAVTLYKFSMVYLALLFLTFAIDRAWWM